MDSPATTCRAPERFGYTQRRAVVVGLLLAIWLAVLPAHAHAITPTPAPTAGRTTAVQETVVKEVCRSLAGYDSLDVLKRELEVEAKRAAANELFGELIIASTTVQNWIVTEDQLRSQSLGLVRVEGSPVFRQQQNPAQLCITLTAYATARDFARFEPISVRGRACESAADRPLPQARTLADEAARLRALRDYDPRLSGYAPANILPLLRQVRYLEQNVAPDTDNYCVAVEGAVIPIEVEGFVLGGGALAGVNPTPELTRPTPTPNATATASAEKTAQALAVRAMLTASAPTPAPPPTRTPNATATARADQTAVARAIFDSLTATAKANFKPAAIPEIVMTRQTNVRSGPGTNYTVLGTENQGARFVVTGRNPAGDWWEIDYNGRTGWVSAGLVTPYNTEAVAVSANLPAAPPTPTPPPAPLPAPSCTVGVDGGFQSIYSSDLGCASGPARVTWASFTPMQRGFLQWRDDAKQVYGFFGDGGWRAVPDTWDGNSTAERNRGAPPPGLLTPIRGTGNIWGTNDDFFNRLGWATGEQKGICVTVQDFQNGFLLRPYRDGTCKDGLFNHAASNPGFPLQWVRAFHNGRWSGVYQ